MQVLDIPIDSLHYVGGRGHVLSGTVLSGNVVLGQKVHVCSPADKIEALVRGIIVEAKLTKSAGAGQKVGLLFANGSLTAVGINKGIELPENIRISAVSA